MATKRIIALTSTVSESNLVVSGVFWFPIATGLAPRTGGSQWVPSGSSQGASQAENDAIKLGSIYEEGWSMSFPVNADIPSIQSILAEKWTNRNVQINGNGQNIYYGAWYDGTTWANS
jgi:hypothetical protein